MKTPREILFDRHQSVETKLDSIRQQALAPLRAPSAAQASREQRRCAAAPSLREIILSVRWHLAGLGAAWLVVLMLNLEYTPNPADGIARAKIPPPRELMAALLEHRRELLELTDSPGATEPPSLPPRRAEIQSRIETV